VKWGERGGNLSFKVRSVEYASYAVTLRLYTDFRHFRLSCDSCINETTTRRALEAVAEWLRPAVERLAVGEWPKWHWNSLDLPAGVGWAVFLRLYKIHNMSYPIRDGDRELLRVEVLDVKSNGEEAKFRLWYYKWHKTRPHQPYVDAEIKSHSSKRDGRIRFIGRVYASEAKGILREHLAKIAELLKREGVEGVTYYEYGKDAFLQFTGAFRDSVLDNCH